VPWQELYSGSLYPGSRCLVGGVFTNAGSVSSKSIAEWKTSSVATGWSGFSGGFTDDCFGYGPKVHGLEATTSSGQSGETIWSEIWVTGTFTRSVGLNTATHIARIASGSTWNYIGKGFQAWNGSGTDAICYGSYYGMAVCRVGSTVYFGGVGPIHKNASGTILDCAPQTVSMLTLTTGSNAISQPCGTELRSIYTFAAKGSDLYASGNLWGTYRFGKLTSGSWSSLASGGPNGPAVSATATSSYVYFATDGSLYRYSP
jgi:hypothetical protein